MKKHQVIIIGGGPAGMTAAIQLKRYGMEPLLFESKRLGGLLWNANLVENYPGFPGGIPGPALVEKISRQFTDLGIRLIDQHIQEVDHDGQFFIATSGEEIYTSEILVLASGTVPHLFPDGLIPDDAASRVYYDVHELTHLNHAWVAIVGAGDAAFDYALNLAGRENHVMIFNRSEEIKSLPLLVSRVQENVWITYYKDTTIANVQVEDEKLLISTVDGSNKSSYKVDALLGAIGRSPAGPKRSERMAANETFLQSSGVLYLIGDLHNGIYRQTAISVGDGLKAAMKIYQFLKEEERR